MITVTLNWGYNMGHNIITDSIVTDTIVHGYNYSYSTVSEKFFVFRTINTNFRLKELSKEDKQ